ncbi:MAG: energy transducer TonB [Bryobacteraceae bacterium]|jgi:TonB family protein
MSVETERRVFDRGLVRLLACAMLVQAASASPAQSKGDDGDKEEEIYYLGPDVVPPRIVKQIAPRRSTNRGVRVVGSVTVALVVSSKGMPKDVRVVKGLDPDVDQSTVEAVEQWRFTPAQKDGKPVAVRISLDIAYHDM